jgi:hypothetical protein
MTLVDPFIPTTPAPRNKLAAKPKPQLVNNVARYIVNQPPKSMDVRPTAARAPSIMAKSLQPTPPVPSRHAVAGRLRKSAPRPQLTAQKAPALHKPQRKKSRRLLARLHLVIGGALIIAVGIFLQSLVVGQLCILGYGVFALIRRVPSRTTFGLGAISLLCVLILRRMNSDNPMADTFAVYAFLLLAIGTITLVRDILIQDKARA